MTFTVDFNSPLCITTSHDGQWARAVSWRVAILKDGREYLATGDSIYQLHESNTFTQSKWLKEQGKSWASPPDYLDPDVKPRDFPIPEKTAFILAALNAAAPTPMDEAA